MLMQIPQLVSSGQARAWREEVARADWVDGKVTAGFQSARAKQNRQIPEDDPVAQRIGDAIVAALEWSPLFLSAALPLRVFPPLFNRYGGGELFDTHVDNAIRQVKNSPRRIRTDLSATLFLTEPEDYDGGELTVETRFGVQAVKLRAGDMVLYPATSLHHVTPVTRGERINAFFWVQSMVRDEGQRSLLFDLDMAIQNLTRDVPDHTSLIELTGVYHNLIRQWAEL